MNYPFRNAVLDFVWGKTDAHQLAAFLLCHADAAELIAPQTQRDALRRRIEAAAKLYCPDLLAS